MRISLSIQESVRPYNCISLHLSICSVSLFVCLYTNTFCYLLLQQQSILKSLMENNNRSACSSWEYAVNDNVGNTWTSQWDLVCDKEYLKNVAEMFFLLGVATGGIISGYLSDKFGRKTMLFISAVLQTIFGKCTYFYICIYLYLYRDLFIL